MEYDATYTFIMLENFEQKLILPWIKNPIPSNINALHFGWSVWPTAKLCFWAFLRRIKYLRDIKWDEDYYRINMDNTVKDFLTKLLDIKEVQEMQPLQTSATKFEKKNWAAFNILT